MANNSVSDDRTPNLPDSNETNALPGNTTVGTEKFTLDFLIKLIPDRFDGDRFKIPTLSIEPVPEIKYIYSMSTNPNSKKDRIKLLNENLRLSHLNKEESNSITHICLHKDEVNKQIEKMLSQGIIRPSTSPWSSPLWVVPKKLDASGERKWRIVIDYRKLNEKTVGDAYPLPNIEDILDQLGHAQYFTTLDLASGFHQIPMNPNDSPKTAFSTPGGHCGRVLRVHPYAIRIEKCPQLFPATDEQCFSRVNS
ncbi:Reverse transcriptase (RNA-dependent DNA polymerase) [Popillia japonica]|uniref:Reverse transcriptase (RNA-dependent DNA polymerase) n=1 Tax=Popillia japonica TaxID=7064 RepID=A0AAW1KKE3_POPJA